MSSETLSATIERLNPAQREAVMQTDGPMLIVAGAGSGKTSVLTARIACLLDKGVAPERILALTFTKKAADEMRSRIIALAGDGARRICMGTFHSVFIRFLRPYADRLNFPVNFTVLDEDDSLSCLKRAAAWVLGQNRPPVETWSETDKKRYREEDSFYKPKILRNIISSCKNELVTADMYAASPERAHADAAAKRPATGRIFLAYRDFCHRMGMMDFDDLLLYTDILMANNPDVMAALAGSFDYILVDEYQDTNYAQYSILRRLTWINKNICVVGDDSQSIYAFRGARIQNIINFKDDFKGCKVIKLEQNYRSSQNIVLAANNLIDKNEGRIPKVCFSEASKGEPISIHSEKTEKDEASYIAGQIQAISASAGKGFGEFAVLYRTNAQSRALEDALVKARIPYKIYSGTSFFQRLEVKDLLAYFRLAVNPRDDESFRRVVNKPVRGFGDAALKLLENTASAWNMTLWDAATNPSIELCGFGPKSMRGLQSFVQMINEFYVLALTRPAYEVASQISDATGFYESYSQETDEDSKKRADNIRELVDSVKSYEEDLASRNEGLPEDQQEGSTLVGYLQNVMLLSNADTEGDEEGKVSLMTVHCAKGLEYDTVFVAGMEKNLFPLEIDGDDFEEEEERRLFYVAMTRAKRKLVLTRAEYRLKFGQRKYSKPSAFLQELKYAGRKRAQNPDN